MSKTFELYCPKHGHLRIEVERPPMLPGKNVYCPWCAQRMARSGAEKEKWIPNYTGAQA